MIRNHDFSSWLPEDGFFGHTSPGSTVDDVASSHGINEVMQKVKETAKVGESPNSIEKWYGVPYHKENILAGDLKTWDEALHSKGSMFRVPEKNRFVPYELTNEVKRNTLVRSIPKLDLSSGSKTNYSVSKASAVVNEKDLESSPPSKIKEQIKEPYFHFRI